MLCTIMPIDLETRTSRRAIVNFAHTKQASHLIPNKKYPHIVHPLNPFVPDDYLTSNPIIFLSWK